MKQEQNIKREPKSVDKKELAVLAIFIILFAYCGYGISKEVSLIKNTKNYPNVLVEKTPDSLVLRDIQDNKERIYYHDLSAKTYLDLNQGDTVYFYSMDYNKKNVFHKYFRTRFQISQRQRH